MTSIKGNNKILKDFKNQIFERFGFAECKAFLHEVYPTKQNQTTNQQNKSLTIKD